MLVFFSWKRYVGCCLPLFLKRAILIKARLPPGWEKGEKYLCSDTGSPPLALPSSLPSPSPCPPSSEPPQLPVALPKPFHAGGSPPLPATHHHSRVSGRRAELCMSSSSRK